MRKAKMQKKKKKNRGHCARFETGGSIRPIFALFELKIAVKNV